MISLGGGGLTEGVGCPLKATIGKHWSVYTEMCAGKIGAVTLKAHGVGFSRMSSYGWKSRLTALQKPTIHHKAGLVLLFVPREWKAYLWGLSPVNCSSLYLNILSSVFSLCLGSDMVNLLLVCSVCAMRRKRQIEADVPHRENMQGGVARSQVTQNMWQGVSAVGGGEMNDWGVNPCR